jgi:hypothetical protein
MGVFRGDLILQKVTQPQLKVFIVLSESLKIVSREPKFLNLFV